MKKKYAELMSRVENMIYIQQRHYVQYKLFIQGVL